MLDQSLLNFILLLGPWRAHLVRLKVATNQQVVMSAGRRQSNRNFAAGQCTRTGGELLSSVGNGTFLFCSSTGSSSSSIQHQHQHKLYW